MEITLDKTNNTEGLIKIKLNEGDYQTKVDEKVKDYARKATIKGFRQGKVPTGVIKRMFGKSIMVEEINHLLSHKLSDYIKDNNIKIIGEPLPNQDKAATIDWDQQKNFEFEYQIGMVEDFKYDVSQKVKVKSYPIEIDDKTLNETLDDLKKRFGKVEYPETSDAVSNIFGEVRSTTTDFKREHAFVDVAKLSKKEQKKFVGLKKEEEVEFDVDATFSDAAEKEQFLGVAGDEAAAVTGKLIFKVNNISKTEPAEVNTELFDRVFGKDAVADEAAFLAKVKETIAENYKRESDHFLDHHIEDYYISNTDINLPDEFLKNWLKSSSKGELTDEVIDREFNDYKRGLKWDLVKNRIAEDNKISVEADEVRSKAKDLILSQFGGPAIAAQLGDRLDAIADNYLQNENGQNFMKIYSQLRSEKILKFIRENISVQEKKVSVDEFKKIVEEHKH
ncbi:trigger factor [Chryseolinea sp. T2]|uniref:trigger factor n=1 Tax=Chryseolinea sp. T2 TaxID=3129255 RepID=UPI00307740A8